MQSMIRVLTLLFGLSCASSMALEGEVCHSAILDTQLRGFENMFSPPYSPSLRFDDGASEGIKHLSQFELDQLSDTKPTVVKRAALSKQHAELLKQWLNEDASATIPSWLSTVAGLGAMVFVPPAWVGLAPDVFIQLINSSGDTGRQTLANLAGAVSEGGIIAITEQVAKTPSGSLKFEWIYLYQANLNGMTITTPLLTCSTDVIVENPSPNPPNILWPAQW